MKQVRTLRGTNSLKKAESMINEHLQEAIEAGIDSSLLYKLHGRGKNRHNIRPDYNDKIYTNNGHDKPYGVKTKKKVKRETIRNDGYQEFDRGRYIKNYY